MSAEQQRLETIWQMLDDGFQISNADARFLYEQLDALTTESDILRAALGERDKTIAQLRRSVQDWELLQKALKQAEHADKVVALR